MAANPVRRRRRELQAQGLPYAEARAQAEAEHAAKVGGATLAHARTRTHGDVHTHTPARETVKSSDSVVTEPSKSVNLTPDNQRSRDSEGAATTAPYEWPQLQPVHGAWSPAAVDPLADRFVQALAHDPATAYLSAPSFWPAVRRWAIAEARVELARRYLEQHGEFDEEGKPRPAVDMLARFLRVANETSGRLGLDPLSRARLGRDVTAQQVDLARLWADAQREDGADDA